MTKDEDEKVGMSRSFHISIIIVAKKRGAGTKVLLLRIVSYRIVSYT